MCYISSKLALGDIKKTTVETDKSRKRKLKLEEIANVKKSNLAVQEIIESLNKSIEKYFAEAELKRKEISHYYQKLIFSETG